MAATNVQLTGIQGNTARNATLGAAAEDQLHPLHQKSVGGAFPGLTMHGGKFLIVNTGSNDLIVNRGSSTVGGTVGFPVGPRGSIDFECISDSDGDVYVYSAAGSTYALVEE